MTEPKTILIFLEVGNLILLPGYSIDLNREVRMVITKLYPDWIVEQVNISELTPLGGELRCAAGIIRFFQ